VQAIKQAIRHRDDRGGEGEGEGEEEGGRAADLVWRRRAALQPSLVCLLSRAPALVHLPLVFFF